MTTYSVMTIDLPGNNAAAWDINNQGDVVGLYETHGFFYSDGSYTAIDPADSTQTAIFSVDNYDEMVGYYIDSSDEYIGFQYSDSSGSYTNLISPYSSTPILTEAYDINGFGDVVGYYRSGSDISSDRAYLFKDGTVYLTIAPSGHESYALAINDSEQVVGYYVVYNADSTTTDHGFLYDYNSDTYTTIDFPGSTQTTPEAINNSGQIVGDYKDSDGNWHAFLFSDGQYTTIDVPGATSTSAAAINASGQIAGYYLDSGGVYHGFMESGGIYTTIDGPSADGTFVYNINDSGEVVGTYSDSAGFHAFFAVLAPELVVDSAHTQAGKTVSVDAAHGVLANDTDPVSGDMLSVTAVDGLSGNVGVTIAGTYGTLMLNADGSYTYDAGKSLPAGGVGVDVFTYTASTEQDGTASSTLSVVVTQSNVNYLGGTAGATITAGNGKSPVLDGSAGDDVLIAGNGAATLIGGPDDMLTGGHGKDMFVFGPGFGGNTITNFNLHKDVIQLAQSEFDDFQAVLDHAQQVGADTVITYDATDSITLTGVQLDGLHAHSFAFV
jgi:probable HAF family extracellular repeat protein/VCBS repeat-containing protein